MNITYQAIECESMSDALQWAAASGQGEAVLIGGEPMVVPKADLYRLAEAGVGFAYLFRTARTASSPYQSTETGEGENHVWHNHLARRSENGNWHPHAAT